MATDERRKVLLVYGCAVGAAVAVVAVVLAMTLGKHSTHAPSVAAVASPARSADVSPSDSPTAATSSAVAPVAPAGVNVLKNFHSDSVWFIDADRGWSLGDGQCAGDTSKRCMAIVRTTDGAATWTAIAAPDGLTADLASCGNNGATPQGPCVNRLVFAGAVHGFVYSKRAMFATSDGGASWQRVPGRYATGGAYAVVTTQAAAARLAALGDCDGVCATRVEVAPLGSNAWTDVTPKAADPGLLHAALVARGQLLALFTDGDAGATTALFISADGGRNWALETSAVCSLAGGTDYSFSGAGIAPDQTIAGTCDAFGSSVGPSSVVTSTDRGTSFTAVGPPPSGGDVTPSVAAESSSHLVAYSWVGGAETLYASADAGRSWHQAKTIDNVPDPQLPSFVTQDFGFIATDPSGVWTTTDSGSTWRRHAVP
jgi:photosystem II stability/assembly factor-like uncharacterized protein